MLLYTERDGEEGREPLSTNGRTTGGEQVLEHRSLVAVIVVVSSYFG